VRWGMGGLALRVTRERGPSVWKDHTLFSIAGHALCCCCIGFKLDEWGVNKPGPSAPVLRKWTVESVRCNKTISNVRNEVEKKLGRTAEASDDVRVARQNVSSRQVQLTQNWPLVTILQRSARSVICVVVVLGFFVLGFI